MEKENGQTPIEADVFASYCDSMIKSITIAINRKLNGSTVEYVYFNEKLDKLRDMFNNHFIKEV